MKALANSGPANPSRVMSEIPVITNGNGLNKLPVATGVRLSENENLPPLTMQEAIEALAGNCARIRVIDARSGRWIELDGDASLVPYLQSPIVGPSEIGEAGFLKLVIRPGMKPRRTLNSWKEVAAYMGRGVRTVQRYEATLGLPVRRAADHERCAVLAFSDELDAWLQTRPMRISTTAIEPVMPVAARSPKRQLSMSA